MLSDSIAFCHNNRSGILRLALQQSGRGRSVFPLRGKEPTTGATPHGCKDASRQPQRVTALFNAADKGRGATGYGIATGRASGVVVVDVDGPEARAEAERRGLRSGHVVKTGRAGGDGWHIYYAIPQGLEVRSRKLAPGLELKGDGSYVVGPGSLHPSGAVYTVVKHGEPSPAPEWIKAEPERDDPTRVVRKPVSVDVAGEPILEGTRDDALTRICGRLHDGSRTLEELTADLEQINAERCEPPLPYPQVAKIARSIHHRKPRKASPEVTPAVLAAVDYLESVERPVKGMAGGSGWSIYAAGLVLARRYGREHPDGVALSIDARTWAQLAGSHESTVSRFIRRSPLVRQLERGSGRRSSTVVFVTPREIGYYLQHSNHQGGALEDTNYRSVAAGTLRRTLQRLRWGPGRIGKSRAALLHAVAECSGPLARAEIANRLGRKPDTLKVPLRWLVDAGLLVRVGRGLYAVPDDLLERVEDAREVGREPEADRLQVARHARQRAGYRKRNEKPDPAPSDGAMRKYRECFPERRSAAIAEAIALLFAERPEYRARRVGQITCALPQYLAPDFPRGPSGVGGLPKDAEVEALLDGWEAA